MIKNEESYVGYVIDHTRGSCYQRRFAFSEQNHSSVLAFIGKDFTGGSDEILIDFLNRQCNLTKCIKIHFLTSITDKNHR